MHPFSRKRDFSFFWLPFPFITLHFFDLWLLREKRKGKRKKLHKKDQNAFFWQRSSKYLYFVYMFLLTSNKMKTIHSFNVYSFFALWLLIGAFFVFFVMPSQWRDIQEEKIFGTHWFIYEHLGFTCEHYVSPIFPTIVLNNKRKNPSQSNKSLLLFFLKTSLVTSRNNLKIFLSGLKTPLVQY